MIGEKKSIYHSALVKYGPAYVTVKGDVKQGKFGPFVVVEHDGTDQFLNLENGDCEDAMIGLIGQSVTITASGAKEGAKLKVDGGTQTVVKKEGAVVPAQPIEVTADQFAQVIQIGLTTAVALKAWAKKKLKVDMTDDQFQGITSTISLFLKDQGYVRTMPVRSGAEQEASAS